MRARSLRTHHMGSSNRDSLLNTENNFKKQTIIERSFNKSLSLRATLTGTGKILGLQSSMKG